MCSSTRCPAHPGVLRSLGDPLRRLRYPGDGQARISPLVLRRDACVPCGSGRHAYPGEGLLPSDEGGGRRSPARQRSTVARRAQLPHFGFMSTGYACTAGGIDVDRYLDLWIEAIQTAGAVERADWDRYFAWLVQQRIATPSDRPEFDRHFTNSVRQTATPSRDPDRAPVATERGGGSASIRAVRAAGPSGPRSDRRTPRSLTSRFSPWPSDRSAPVPADASCVADGIISDGEPEARIRSSARRAAASAGHRSRVRARSPPVLTFARCIRSHGFPSFPDPTSSGELTHQMVANAGVSLRRPAILQAGDA